MSVGTTAALTIAGIGAAGSIGSAAIGAHAAGKAADQQVNAENQALDFQKQVYGNAQQNQQGYVDLGNQTAKQLMQQLQNGTFGAGSNPSFAAPTLDQARATPGYQFTLQQGLRGVDAGAAARGGVLSGGAIKGELGYATGLADTTYNDVFNRALAGYQTNLAKQNQEFGQEFGTAQLGENAITSINNTGTGAATNVGNIMAGIGNAQAAGTVGTANAINQGIGGVTNAATQGILLNSLGNMFGGGTQPQVPISYFNRTSGLNIPG